MRQHWHLLCFNFVVSSSKLRIILHFSISLFIWTGDISKRLPDALDFSLALCILLHLLAIQPFKLLCYFLRIWQFFWWPWWFSWPTFALNTRHFWNNMENNGEIFQNCQNNKKTNGGNIGLPDFSPSIRVRNSLFSFQNLNLWACVNLLEWWNGEFSGWWWTPPQITRVISYGFVSRLFYTSIFFELQNNF